MGANIPHWKGYFGGYIGVQFLYNYWVVMRGVLQRNLVTPDRHTLEQFASAVGVVKHHTRSSNRAL